MVVVFSDFLLTDTAPAAELDRLCQLDADVHAVVLGARPPAVLADTGVTTWTIGVDSKPGAVAEALATAVIDARAGQVMP